MASKLPIHYYTLLNQSHLLANLTKEAFKNIAGKGDSAGKQNCSQRVFCPENVFCPFKRQIPKFEAPLGRCLLTLSIFKQ